MKKLIKRVLKALWRATGPIRRPLQSRIEGVAGRALTEGLAAEVQPQLRRIEASGNHANALAYEMNLALNSLVREVARLQIQIELLEQEIRDGSRGRGLSLLADVEDDDAMMVG
jgi:hypothetical protein